MGRYAGRYAGSAFKKMAVHMATGAAMDGS